MFGLSLNCFVAFTIHSVSLGSRFLSSARARTCIAIPKDKRFISHHRTTAIDKGEPTGGGGSDITTILGNYLISFIICEVAVEDCGEAAQGTNR